MKERIYQLQDELSSLIADFDNEFKPYSIGEIEIDRGEIFGPNGMITTISVNVSVKIK